MVTIFFFFYIIIFNILFLNCSEYRKMKEARIKKWKDKKKNVLKNFYERIKKVTYMYTHNLI